MPTRKQLDERHKKQVHYEVWFGGADFRHCKANSEDYALKAAAEFKAEGHPNIEIVKVTTTTERLKD